MATWLARIGAASMRRAWLVVITWAVVLGGILGGALALGPNMQESFEIPGTESQIALDRLGAVFPQVSGATVQVVIEAPDGDTVDDFQTEITGEATAIGELDGVASVVDPWSEYAVDTINDDRSMAIMQVVYESSGVADDQLVDLQATADELRADGLTVEFSGQALQATSVGVTWVEGVGVLVAAIILIVAFWSVLAAGLPLLSALIGVGITMGGILGASALVTVSNSAPLMALMIGLAVGIDYALFILSKHRTQLARGMSVAASGAKAVGTAGTAVVFAGLTVVIALLGLLIVNIPFLSTMGIGAAAAVAVSVAATITLMPAVMSLLGERLRPKPGSRAERLANRDPDVRPTVGMRWVTLVTRMPAIPIIATIALLGGLAIPAASMQLALPDNGSEPAGSTARESYDMLAEGFGPGTSGPLIVMVDITQTTDIFGVLDAIAADLEDVPGVASVGSRVPNATADTAIIQVVSETTPSSRETIDVVHAIRALAPDIEAEFDTPIAVTGSTAVAIDISTRLGDALVPFGIVVVVLAFLLLMLVFRSILVPLTAALGFLLSVAAAIGVTVAVMQWGWGASLIHAEAGPILSFMPVLLMSVLFGLAMDYQVFLVSGMREAYVRGHDPVSAVRHGFAANARVVTAAALIMLFVFFAFVPEGMQVMKAIALGLAVGVAVDAFLVRMTLIPAVLSLLGRSAWWLPTWLDRILPHADVEGESLGMHDRDLEWASETGGHVAMDALVAGRGHVASTPLTAVIPNGALVRLSGGAAERRALALTLAGQLTPVSGRVHVAGGPLPGDSRAASRIVAIADLGEQVDSTVRETLAERLAVSAGWRRLGRTRAAEDALIAQIRAALPADDAAALTERAVVDSLSPVARATVLAAAALASGPQVLVVDGPHGLPDGAAAAIARIAPPSTTVIVAEHAAAGFGRTVIDLEASRVEAHA